MPATISKSSHSNNNNNDNNNNKTSAAIVRPSVLLHPCLATYANNGGCRFGDKCKFALFPRNTCMEHLKKGVCSRGSNCRFHHANYNPHFNNKKNSNDDDDDLESRVSDSELFPSLIAADPSSNNNNSTTTTSNANKPSFATAAAAVASTNAAKEEKEESTSKPIIVIPKKKENCCDSSCDTHDLFPLNDPGTNYNNAGAAAVANEDSSNKNLIMPTPGLSAAFAYKLHTLNARVNNYVEAKNEEASLRQKLSSLQSENVTLTSRARRQESEVRRALDSKFGAQLAAEKNKNDIIENSLNMSESIAKLESRQAFEFANIVTQLVSSASSEISATASAKAKSKNNKSTNDVKKSINITLAESVGKVLSILKSNIASNEERLRRATVYLRVCEIAAAEFAKQNTNNNMRLQAFRPNECMLTDNSPVVRKFFNAVPRSEKFLTECGKFLSPNFTITFHGTRGGPEVARTIECEGFSPLVRGGQAYGRGEYSSPELSMAHGYGCNAVLAVLIYTKPKVAPVSYHYDGRIVVVDNPINFTSTYMLPLGTCIGEGTVMPAKKCSCSV